VRKQLCKKKHRMIMVVDDLWMCECSVYGRLASRKGIEEEARKLVNAAGGIDALRDKILREEQAVAGKRKVAARMARS
jgi:hypothetical protein